MNDEILRLVDTIHRSKEIEKEIVFLGIEAALLSAVKKKLGESEDFRVSIDRRTGEMNVFDGETKVEIEDLGRLAAMTGKQTLFQKIREAERDRIFEDFSEKVGKLVTGIVQRMEGPNMIVNLGKVEGFLPRSEQVPGEKFKVGERIKVLIKDLRKNTSRVKIILSRTSPDLVRNLFALEVPEIADKVIEIKEIAREPGYRTKIAVTTYDSNVDCVGACVGVRGSRIKNIVDELFGEKIDIVRWNESIEVLIMNGLKPAEISSMDLDFDKKRAIVYVRPDQQSLAIGKRGQNVRLASRLSGWELDVVSVSEEELEQLRREDISQEDEDAEAATAEAESAGAASEGESESEEAGEPGEGEDEDEELAPLEAGAEPDEEDAGPADEALDGESPLGTPERPLVQSDSTEDEAVAGETSPFAPRSDEELDEDEQTALREAVKPPPAERRAREALEESRGDLERPSERGEEGEETPAGSSAKRGDGLPERKESED